MELSLVAAETGTTNDGRLPPVKDIAWRLHTPVSELNKTLRALARIGFVHRETDGTWVVSKFASQQEPITVTERVQSYRKRLAEKSEAKHFKAAEAAAAETFHSSSDSASSSLSQGEEVQGEGDATSPDAAQPSQADPNAKTPRKRHKPVGSPRSDHDRNAGTREAERLLLTVAGMAALPPGEVPRVEQVAALAARYGPEAAPKELADQRQRWLKTVSEKTGKR